MARPLQAALPDFRPVKLGFVSEGAWIARCVRADSSRWSKAAFYIHAFALPLFVPEDALIMSHGVRVGEGPWDKVDDELVSAVEQQLPMLNRLATLEGFVEDAPHWQTNIRDTELQLCIAALWRNEPMVRELDTILRARVKSDIDWEREIEERCAALLQTIKSEGFDSAQAMLAARRPGVLALLD